MLPDPRGAGVRVISWFIRPLFQHGPRWLGGYRGVPPAAICAELNPGFSAEFWTRPGNVEECEEFVAREFNAWELVVHRGLCVAALIWLLGFLVDEYRHARGERLLTRLLPPSPPLPQGAATPTHPLAQLWGAPWARAIQPAPIADPPDEARLASEPAKKETAAP